MTEPYRRTLTKDLILEAIEVETSLYPGNWILGAGEPDCMVCAVGAVLWHGRVFEEDIETVAEHLCRSQSHLDYIDWTRWADKPPERIAENPLAALSALFETTWNKLYYEKVSLYEASLMEDEAEAKHRAKIARKVKPVLKKFVRSKRFPEKIVIEWNGDARYVRVVQA